MASFTGKLQDFYDVVLPKIRNEIATMTKKKKIELEYICQHCNQKKELESAHKKGRSLKDIAKNVLEHYKSENDTYVVADLHQLILKIKGEHVPIENSFLFLCAECHRKYDGKSTLKNKIKDDKKQLQNVYVNNGDSDYRKEFLQLLHSVGNLKDNLKKLFIKFPDTVIKSTDLRNIWEKEFPGENSKKVTDYLWILESEGVLEKTSRANYKASNSIRDNAAPQSESTEINDIKNKIKDDKKQLQNAHTNNEDKSVKINNGGNKNPDMIPQKDQEFSEKELYAQFQVRKYGGIRPSDKNKVIILINSYFSETQGKYQDKIDVDSGFIYYDGEGEGDQEMKRNNKSIYESKSSGRTMLYFEKSELNRLYFRYKVEYDSHKIEKQPNLNGRMRNVIKFKLKIID